MLPDVKTKPSDSRIRELAERLKVPEQVDRQLLPLNLVFKRVQQQFHDEVCELQSKSRTMTSTNPAAKKARLATAVASSGGPHLAPSNRVDEVESSSSGDAHLAAAVGHENSGVGQPAARGFTLATEAGAKGADAESSGISEPAARF